MDKNRKIKLINLLAESYPNSVSGDFLATNLNVTTRTIRNYIKELNNTGYLIESNKNGYTYKRGTILQSSSLSADSKQILMKIIRSHNFTISCITLENSLNISDSTLRRRLAFLQAYLNRFKIKIMIQGNQIKLDGPDSSIRHLIYTVLQQESQKNILSTLSLSQSEVEFIKNTLQNILKNHSISVNQGIFNNIVMHIAILLFRLNSSNKIDLSNNLEAHNKIKKTTAYHLAQEILNQLNQKFFMKYTSSEADVIALQLLDVFKNESKEAIELKNIIEKQFWLLATLIIHMIDNNYNLQLQTNEEFTARFALHMQNLYYRLGKVHDYEESVTNKNIKQTFPFVYDIAVYTSAQLSDIFDKELSENEIDLIALHLGTLFMTGIKENSQVFYLVDNNYLGSNSQIITKLKHRLGSQISIDDTYQDFSELPDSIDPLRVITTYKLAPDSRILTISPFVSTKDIALIEDRIKELEKTMKSNLLANYIKRFLPRSLVFKEKYYDSYRGYIEFLSQQLAKYGYVDFNFGNDVLKREEMSATDFVTDVAIPHTLKSNTAQTTIAMIVNKKASLWKHNTVHIIVMLALSKNDRKDFQVILDALISTLSEKEKINQIISTQTYQELIDILQNELDD